MPGNHTAEFDRLPAPGSLALVQDFINSTEMPYGIDQLGSTELAAAWLRTKSIEAVALSERDRKRLIAAREGLRELLTEHTGHQVDPMVAARLGNLLSHAPLRPVLSSHGATLAVDGAGVDAFLGRISMALVEATLTAVWERLKVCRRDACRWAYYDHSKNRRGTWCSMRDCGARDKQRAYRERHRITTAGTSVRQGLS